MSRWRALLAALALTGPVQAQSRLDYGLYRVVVQGGQAQFRSTLQARAGERLRLIAHLTTRQDAQAVTATLPLPQATRFGGGVKVPNGTRVSYSIDGSNFHAAFNSGVRFVRFTVPYAAAQQPYTFSFDVIVTGAP